MEWFHKDKVPDNNWNDEIKELKDFFGSVDIPDTSIKLDNAQTVNNVAKFIETHFETIENNNGSIVFIPYLIRLKKMRVVLELF